MLDAVQQYAIPCGRQLASWRTARIPSSWSIRTIDSGVSALSRNMREACTLTPGGLVGLNQGSTTVFTLGTTTPMRARHPPAPPGSRITNFPLTLTLSPRAGRGNSAFAASGDYTPSPAGAGEGWGGGGGCSGAATHGCPGLSQSSIYPPLIE